MENLPPDSSLYGNKLYFQALQKSPDAVVWVDAATGRIHHANRSACRRLEYEYHELTAIALTDLDPALAQNGWSAYLRRLRDSPDYIYESSFLTKSGNPLPIEMTASLVESEKNACLCCFIRDVSQCRRAEARSRQSEERLRAIVQALPDLVFVLDEDGRHLEVLTARKNLLYASPDQIRGRYLHDIFSKQLADTFLALIQDTLRTNTGRVIAYELPIDGKTRCFEARTAPMGRKHRGKKAIVWLARDITDRKRAEKLKSQNLYLQEELKNELNYGEIIGESSSMKAVFKNIDMVAGTDATVLVLGETGTGKELVARAIHSVSKRKHKPLIKINCGAFAPGLVENELFGHEKGGYTGADSRKKGRFELAHQATLFLDEVGELPPEAQIKLLRVLQEQEFERIGGEASLKVDVRVIAATNHDLEAEVKEGRFRSDLFYRLNIFPIRIPPLRERKEDITHLTDYLVEKISARLGKRIEKISPEVIHKLTGSDWPGNVRELANILERAVILCRATVLTGTYISGLSTTPAKDSAFPSLEEIERRHILSALEKTNGVLSGPNGAAALLKINRSTLWSRMQKLGIQVSKVISA